VNDGIGMSGAGMEGTPMGELGEESSTPQHRLKRLAYAAFCATHERAWTALSRARIGDRATADLVVVAMETHLSRTWDSAMRHPMPAAYAWRLINQHVDDWVADEPETEVEMTTFISVIDSFRNLAAQALEEMPEQIGLYSAILALPDRQRAVVILRYVLDLDETVIGEYIDRPIATVRSNLRHARARLAKQLKLSDLPEHGGKS
jgi:DNA-directed RNA polymerase specialized sigma24 family protein